jgi:N-methylhydantoinase B
MGATLERVGGTVNTTQQKDYMAAIYRSNGDVLSTGDTFPQHAACAGFAVKRIIERFANDDGIHPDDIFLLNDPYLAAIHQSDVYTISPIHVNGQLIGWSATFVHVMDIGAMSPGGNSPGATEIFHEGLRLPGIKLVERGKLRKDLFDTITNMTRQPVMVGLDLKCEIAANNVAKSRMQELCCQYGCELIEAVFADMITYTESVLRRRISEIPDGIWTEEGSIEAEKQITVRLSLQKTADHLTFDFAGTDAQSRKGINLPYHATFGGCFASVLHTIGYDLPKNQGSFSPIKVIAPESTVVNVRYPGPVSMNTTSGMFTVLYLSGAVLNQMLATSEKWRTEVIAQNAGNRTARHAGINQYGRYYVTGIGSENALSGSGARSYADGVDSGGRTTVCPNVEWVEQNFPLLYLFRRNVKDSAGAGKFRGGFGAESAMCLHDAPEQQIKGVAMGLAGLRNSGQGLFGGYPGAPSLLLLIENTTVEEFISENSGSMNDLAAFGGTARSLPYSEFHVKKGDLLYIRTASGGGYGDPLDREAKKVAEDVADELVTTGTATRVYGVVITDGQLDIDATNALRLSIREARKDKYDVSAIS